MKIVNYLAYQFHEIFAKKNNFIFIFLLHQNIVKSELLIYQFHEIFVKINKFIFIYDIPMIVTGASMLENKNAHKID